MKVFKNSYCKKAHIYLSFAFLISLIYSCTRETTKYKAIEKVRTYCLDFKNKKYISFTKFNTVDSNIQINCLDSSFDKLTFIMEEIVDPPTDTKLEDFEYTPQTFFVYSNPKLYVYSKGVATGIEPLEISNFEPRHEDSVCDYMIDYCHCIKQNKYDAQLVIEKLKTEELLHKEELFFLTSALIGRFSYIYTIKKRQTLLMRDQLARAPYILNSPNPFKLQDSLIVDFFD